MPFLARALKRLGISLYYDPAEDPGRATNRTLLVLFLLLVLAPFVFTLNREQGCLALAGHELPVTCASKRWFDRDCPGCGMSRSFVALVQLDLRESLRWNRVGPLLYFFCVFQVGFRAWALRQKAERFSEAVGRKIHYLGWAVIGMLLANWLVGAIFLNGSNGS
ncbi:MAG: DUF2752 domain-containing protein [Planctomycetes bacterium]|nr:DUF2752 domain-containing protein [Planctomycetota bacterium]